MYILKNAWTSITRNKGRNILMAIIVIVISAACAVTLSIKNSAETIISSYEDGTDIVATIGFNRQNLMQNFTGGSDNAEANIESFNNIESITADEITTYGDSDYVSSYYYTSTIYMNGNNIDAATSSFTRPNSGGKNFPGSSSSGETIKSKDMASGDFTLIGYSSLNDMSDFIDGTYTIESGEISTDFLTDKNCLISSELATLNELEVGDTIKLESTNDDSITIKLTVVGIYTENEESTTTSGFSMFSNSANQIITNNSVIETITSKDEDTTVTYSPKFTLVSSDVIENFQSELYEKGLNENYSVSTNLTEIKQQTEGVSNLKTFATTFLIVTLIIGSVVLFVINMINIRERKYEIGVLRTIGMKKSAVSVQFTTELLIVSLCGLIIGAGIGACMSVPTANSLLASEIENSSNSQNKIAQNFGHQNMSEFTNPSESSSQSTSDNISKVPTFTTKNVNQVSTINAVVNFKVLGELLIIGLILTLISSLASMISIARFSPLTILKERS